MPILNLTNASPTFRVFSILFLLLAFVVIIVAVVMHHHGSGGSFLVRLKSIRVPTAGRTGLLYAFSGAFLLFCSGAWFGASARNAVTLLVYGSLSDLTVGPARNVDPPAVISLRRDNNLVCFYTAATFFIRNATSSTISVGLISNTVGMQDNTNAPIFVMRYTQDITATGANVSGLQLVKGTAENWYADIGSKANQLTSFRPGEGRDVTIVQTRDFNNNCLGDPDGAVEKNYAGSTVHVSGEVVIIFPDGQWERQGIDSGDMNARVERY